MEAERSHNALSCNVLLLSVNDVVTSAMLDGEGPVNLFPCSSKYASILLDPSRVGIVPVKRLNSKFNFVKEANDPRMVGIVPRSCMLGNDSACSFEYDPRRVGSVPVNKFDPKLSDVIVLDNLRNEEGMVGPR